MRCMTCCASTLESWLKRKGPLGPVDVDRILRPLLDGLEQVHAAGFLHRDIKPANILLDGDGNPTLIDSGPRVQLWPDAPRK